MNLPKNFFIALALFWISVSYLHPSEGPLFGQSEETFLSDGTDPTAVPYNFWAVKSTLTENPMFFIYGATPVKEVSAPDGFAMWASYFEKIFYLIFSPIVPSTQATALFVLIGFILNGIAFFFFARDLKWSMWLAFAGSMAWSFNCYTMARAKVHSSLVAIYFVPLAFLLFSKLRREHRWFSWSAALGFLAIACEAHYYIIMLFTLSPFLLWYLLIGTKDNSERVQRVGRTFLTALPAALLLAFVVLKPLPNNTIDASQAFPRTGETHERFHPFMTIFAAQPIDYLGGEFAIGMNDLNPLRQMVSEYIVENINPGNTHERSNGIRWSFFIVLFCAGFWIARKKWIPDSQEKAFLWCLGGFTLFAFLMSLQPELFGLPIGPSGWVHKLISQFRVPSRAGIFVHFGILVLAGYFLNKFAPKKFHWLAAVVVILEMPPFLNPLPMAPIAPKYESLQVPAVECGTGMYFPYVSGQWGLLEFYTFLQRMRGSRCPFINAGGKIDREEKFLNRFPLHPQVIQAMQTNDPRFRDSVISFIQCTNLSWVVFDRHTPPDWRTNLCQSLGWKMMEPDVCRSSSPTLMKAPFPAHCL